MFNKLTLPLLVSALFATPVLAASDKHKIEEIVEMLEANPEIVDGLHESLAMYIKQQQPMRLTFGIISVISSSR